MKIDEYVILDHMYSQKFGNYLKRDSFDPVDWNRGTLDLQPSYLLSHLQCFSFVKGDYLVSTFIFQYLSIISKLMRSNRGLPKIRSKSYWNCILIDIFDPNLPVRSIVATISIQIRTEISIFNLIIVLKRSILSKIGQIWA